MDSRARTLKELYEKNLSEELLFSLVEKNNIDDLKMLIEKVEPELNINTKNKDGCAPLIVAAKNCHSSIIKVLIEAKTDIEAKDKNGKTALGWATYKGDLASIKALI